MTKMVNSEELVTALIEQEQALRAWEGYASLPDEEWNDQKDQALFDIYDKKVKQTRALIDTIIETAIGPRKTS